MPPSPFPPVKVLRSPLEEYSGTYTLPGSVDSIVMFPSMSETFWNAEFVKAPDSIAFLLNF